MASNYVFDYTDILVTPITVAPKAKDTTTTSIVLYGEGNIEYGEKLQENILHILENFALDTAPTNPIVGQLWYNKDSGTKQLGIWDGGSWLGLLDQTRFGQHTTNAITDVKHLTDAELTYVQDLILNGITATDSPLLDGNNAAYYLNATNINAGTLSNARLSGTYNINVTGTSASATLATTANALTVPRNIVLAGDITGVQVFDGSTSITITVTANTVDDTDAYRQLTAIGNSTSGYIRTPLNGILPDHDNTGAGATATCGNAAWPFKEGHFEKLYLNGNDMLNMGSSGSKHFLYFDGTTPTNLGSSAGLTITKLGTGQYRINMAVGYRPPTADYAIIIHVDNELAAFGADKHPNTISNASAIKVMHTWVVTRQTNYFDFTVTNNYNTAAVDTYKNEYIDPTNISLALWW